MLILSRKIGETLIIGDDIKVIVLGIKGNQVRLGIQAKKDVPVHRQEIYDRIRAQKESYPANDGKSIEEINKDEEDEKCKSAAG